MTPASRIADLAEQALRRPLPLRVRAWDGSEAGAAADTDPPVLVARSRRALRHLLWRPDELGLARAYVSGDLDIDGDLTDGLRRVWKVIRQRDASAGGPPRRRVVAGLLRLGVVGPPPRPPAAESALTGRRHSRTRDRAAIAHHYDLSNEFYALLLDRALTYSCAYWTHQDSAYPLEQAQVDKLDLVCRKLGLGAGNRLLDVGCGWGSLTLHAAREYGARVIAVTLSAQQHDYVTELVTRQGLDRLVEVRRQHYRDIDDTDFDAVASIEMGEHVGDREYVDFAAALHRFLRPRGRLLIQQMSRNGSRPGGGPFIETYIAPDMHMKPLATTLGLLAEAGLEVRHVEAMREHYPRTVRAWAQKLEQRWDEAVALVGVETARVWRLYLAGGALAFEENRMGVDQILAVRADSDGDTGMPLTPAAWTV